MNQSQENAVRQVLAENAALFCFAQAAIASHPSPAVFLERLRAANEWFMTDALNASDTDDVMNSLIADEQRKLIERIHKFIQRLAGGQSNRLY